MKMMCNYYIEQNGQFVDLILFFGALVFSLTMKADTKFTEFPPSKK